RHRLHARWHPPARRGDGAGRRGRGGARGPPLRHAAAREARRARERPGVVPLLPGAPRDRGVGAGGPPRAQSVCVLSGEEDLYRENILDHYKHPRNRGTLDQPDITYEDSNPLCGDRLRIDLTVKDGRIEQIRFSGVGCSISQAAASMLCEEVEGKTLEEVK